MEVVAELYQTTALEPEPGWDPMCPFLSRLCSDCRSDRHAYKTVHLRVR